LTDLELFFALRRFAHASPEFGWADNANDILAPDISIPTFNHFQEFS